MSDILYIITICKSDMRDGVEITQKEPTAVVVDASRLGMFQIVWKSVLSGVPPRSVLRIFIIRNTCQ